MTRNGSKNPKGTDTETEAKIGTGKAKRKDTKRGHGYHIVMEQQMGKQAERVRMQTRNQTMKRKRNARRISIEKGTRTERGTAKTGTTLTEPKAKGEICRLLQRHV